jgi:hypothetical protein
MQAAQIAILGAEECEPTGEPVGKGGGGPMTGTMPAQWKLFSTIAANGRGFAYLKMPRARITRRYWIACAEHLKIRPEQERVVDS